MDCVLCKQTIMAVNVPGLVAVVVFYIVILVIGIWASRKSKKVENTCAGSKSEVTIVGGRNINVLVGVFTMTGRTCIFHVCHLAALEVYSLFCLLCAPFTVFFSPSSSHLVIFCALLLATWVGGGYIMGTAEAVYSPSQGLIWAMGPPAYLINFLLGK